MNKANNINDLSSTQKGKGFYPVNDGPATRCSETVYMCTELFRNTTIAGVIQREFITREFSHATQADPLKRFTTIVQVPVSTTCLRAGYEIQVSKI